VAKAKPDNTIEDEADHWRRWRHACQWRTARILRFMDRQKKQRAWIQFSELAERYGRNIGTAEGYEQLKRAVIDGKFERNGRSRVFYLHPGVTATKMTREKMRNAVETFSLSPETMRRQYLACCWIPRELADAWLQSRGIEQAELVLTDDQAAKRKGGRHPCDDADALEEMCRVIQQERCSVRQAADQVVARGLARGTGVSNSIADRLRRKFPRHKRSLMGDYATIADVGTFIASNTERHPTDVAKLHGYRLVVAQETEKGRRWDETKIKSMTGGDRMTARFMRCDFFDFIPKFKLWIVGNHKPRLDNVDEAMRRRMLLVPFTVQIPAEERDTDLPEKLKAEWPAILRWALDGCLEWQRIGLDPPAIVTEATDEYFEDQDTTRQWLEDCTTDAGPFAFTPTAQLFTSWREWCTERNLQPGTGQAFTDGLADRGYVRKRGTGGGRGFRNLSLKMELSDA
jgi:P4 family phage/plasmid primase-like protien